MANILHRLSICAPPRKGPDARTGIGRLNAVALVIAPVIGGLAITQAILHHTLEPIWMVGWIPAVLVAVMRPRKSGRCGQRGLRRRVRP